MTAQLTATLPAVGDAEPRGDRWRESAVAALFTCTSFTGAGLLFLVQPMVAKLLLPLFGGSPSVWNTSSLFFQVTLLAGYVLTHLSIRRFGPRRQSRLQVLLLLLPLLVLPIGLPSSPETPAGTPPALWLLLVLTVTVGAPFLLVSTAGPLLQRWFGATSHPRAADPYFLFAAGNAGSLLALLAYPTVVEPRLTLDDQLQVWSAGYVVFVVLVSLCALALRRPASRTPPVPEQRSAPAHRISRVRSLRWVALAALPSSFMLGTTTYLTTDLTPLPLLWVVPLSLYLLTFIVAFALAHTSAATLSRRAALLIPALVVPVVLGATGTALPLWIQVATHLTLFTVVALAAHARLAADRPGIEHLTGFYMLLAVGGALGGGFNALVAPVLFDRVYEYPLVIALAVLLTHRAGGRANWVERRYGLLGAVALVVLGLAALPALSLIDALSIESGPVLAGATVLLMMLLGRFGARRAKPYALGLVLILVVPLMVTPTLATSRTFFGVQQVRNVGGVHSLTNGSTVHGTQDLRPGRAAEPRSYYHRKGPVGQVFASFSDELVGGQIGVVGLGTGALAAYGRPGQSMTFFEIDPATEDIARDPRLFRYLSDSGAAVEVVLGDGRLSLQDQPAGKFDVLVLDAFSSDAIPVHLLTKEAVDLYLSRLRPDGLLLFHISNRYLDLAPVLADVARAANLLGVRQFDPTFDAAEGRLPSSWVVLTRDRDRFDRLLSDPRWKDLGQVGTSARPWTDDFSNVLGALR